MSPTIGKHLDRVVSASEMRDLEQKGEKLGISKIMMMENAGSAIARFIRARINPPSRIAIIAGTGNNGGDAFVAARHLVYWKYSVSLILLGDEGKIHAEEALANWKIVKEIPSIRRRVISKKGDLVDLERELLKSKALVIAIFGTGFKGEPKPLQRRAISVINKTKSEGLKISVDIPSGMEADSGESKYAVISDATISMHAAKKGELSTSARQKCGELFVENIGLPF